MKKKTRNRIFYGILVVLTVLFLLLNAMLLNRWYGYLIVVAACGGMVAVHKIGIVGGWRKLVLWILLVVIFFSSAIFCRADMQVSLMADVYRSFQRTVNFSYQAFTGKSLVYDQLSVPSPDYAFDSWKPPAGYTNTEVFLEHCRGYYLEKEGVDNDYIVYQLHGGGYISKYSAFYNEIALRYAEAAEAAAVFSLDYRTAPENRYPCALEDALDGYEYILECGYAPDHIIVCGDSAGGGLSLALGLRLKALELPMPGMFILSSPYTDLSHSGESNTSNATKDVIFGGWNQETVKKDIVPSVYASQEQLSDPYVSPVFGSFEGFPPVFVTVGTDEMLLDDTLRLVTKLNEGNVENECLVQHGMYHTYNIITPVFRESQEAWQEIAVFIQTHK